MKIKIILYFIIMIFIFGCAGAKKFVQPGGEYENNSKETIYLLMPLKPGETFINPSERTFKVLKSPRDFLKFSKQLKVDFMIETATKTINAKIDSLNNLETSLKSEQTKRDTLK